MDPKNVLIIIDVILPYTVSFIKTPQSVTYGLKTLMGFGGFNLAFRNYSDPSYYTPGPDEIQYKNFNINRDTEYESLWHSLVWSPYYDTTYPIIGHENNLLHLKDNSRYMLEFQTKGDTFSPTIRLVMIEKNQTRIRKNSLWEINPDKWSLFKGYFDVGAPFSDSLGTKTSDPVTITWKIDEEIDFSTFIPARRDQRIFFKYAWGQRYRDNRDFGATLP
ncbi:hypothetical protein M9Y10_015596 [Tritrichomonas musculus]|uniref:Uncharacterized protein n=1 Tax=Tritrichomonas musculus TaxID=1915356 RepID=A0ABR2L3M2_9EUKA